MTDPYNPLDKLNLGKSVAEALLDSKVHPIGELPRSEGAGIYVIYYKGPFPAYELMAQRNADALEWPIYIGQAIPSGRRKGEAVYTARRGTWLWSRLREHARSIEAADNLEVGDFECRYLVVDDIWIPLGETLLIATFRPVWNLVLDGFGNHDPGSGRIRGLRPRWDTLHPGRTWAPKYPPRPESPEELAKSVQEFLRANVPPRDPHLRFAPDSELSVDEIIATIDEAET